jgi:hypothetical protein
MKKKLYGFAILYHDTINEPGKQTVIKTTMLVPATEILAINPMQAFSLASMQVPAEYKDKMEFVEILVWGVEMHKDLFAANRTLGGY